MLISFQVAFAQELDTAKTLDEVVIKAFAHDRPLLDVPASVASIGQLDLQRFSNTNFLPALNAQPGVRMEERSPGSYRLSIRGSTIRSPFGVRNVKVYWNGLPLTDHGGNTYLNLLDFGSVDNAEVIKGPGSSLYGAGTGGVLLLNKSAPAKNQASTEITGGSFGLLRYRVGTGLRFNKGYVNADFAQQQSDGYREQSAMNRKVANVKSGWELSKKSSLSLSLLYSDLFYQTPGGLTKAQFEADPTQARPAGGPNPGAVQQKASIYNKTFLGGVSFGHDWSSSITSTMSVFGNATDFKNPAILNYEKRDEKGFGFRNENAWTNHFGKLIWGAEYQQGRSLIYVGQNAQGSYVDAGNSVRLPVSIFYFFTQYDWQLPQNFFLTAGASLNRLHFEFDDYTSTDARTLSPISPRVALLKKLSNKWSAYASFSRGYSPPTTAELFPSTAVYDPNLKPEFGNNYEVGVKGSQGWLEASVTLYSFQLQQTIIRLDSAGQDYFTNANNTAQNGAEVFLKVNPGKSILKGWVSYSYNHYRFKNYVLGDVDFSNHALTGVAPHVASMGLDFTASRFYANATANYVSRLPLNDSNSEYAAEYFLLGLRCGYKFRKLAELFVGGDNLLDEQYSLGHDINARGGRYYNAAAGRNFYVGLKVSLTR